MSITDSHLQGIVASQDVSDFTANSRASEKIWNRYFERLLRFATVRMRGMPKVVADEEDIALSVLESVCMQLRSREDGGTEYADESGVWSLLVLICKRKIANQYAYQNRGKREIARSESLFSDPGLLSELQSQQIEPAQMLEFNESMDQLFALLEKDVLKQVALAKVHGFTNSDIASQLGCSLSTVERKLRLIREIWSRESEPE